MLIVAEIFRACSYISAENLAEILGQDFPRAEIDAIIKEATGGANDRISYSEFLKLWEEKQEASREQMIQELAYIEAETNSVASIDFDGGNEARADFIGKKIQASAKSAMAEANGNDAKHVGFAEGHVVIPTHKEAVI